MRLSLANRSSPLVIHVFTFLRFTMQEKALMTQQNN